MGHHEVEIPEDVTIPSSSMWAKLPLIGAVLAVVGLGAGFGALAMDLGEGAGEHIKYAYLFAFMFWLSIGLGSLIFTLIQHVVRAGWSVVPRRIAENMMMTLPVMAIMALPIIFLFSHDLYPWTHEEHLDDILKAKAPYLNEGFWKIRSIGYLLIWSALSFLLYTWSRNQDDTKSPDLTRKLIKLSFLGIPLYALSSTFASFDWVMSLQPHWYSTIFGVYYFASSLLAAFSVMILVAMGLQKAGLVKTAFTTEHFHGMGLFVFGFTVFWTYIAFSQFMLIWYANIPEEVEFFYHRVHADHGWATMSYLLPIAGFFIPFFYLLSRHIKRHRVGLAIGCVWVLIWRVVDHYWNVMPMAGQNHGHFEHFPNGLIWVDMMMWIGIGGVFLAAFGFFLNRSKLVPVGDPRLIESMTHEHF
jgi:hypothetical protein